MKKRKILMIILIIVIALFKINVKAATCTTSEKSDLKKLARLIEINPVIDKETDPLHHHVYSISINNFSDDFYIIDQYDSIYEYSEEIAKSDKIGIYYPGNIVTFKVYGAIGKTCAFEQLATIRVTFPFYNDYYLSPSCEGIEEFYLCQKTYSGKIENEAWFEEQVKKYKESLVEEEPVVEEPTTIEKLTDYIKNNPVIIVVAVVSVVLIITIIVIKVKSNKKKIKINLDFK